MWRKMVVCGSTLAIIFSPEYPSGGERGGVLGFSHQSILGGGTGDFPHPSVPSGMNGGIIFFIFPFHGARKRTCNAWPLIVYILSMEDCLVLPLGISQTIFFY